MIQSPHLLNIMYVQEISTKKSQSLLKYFYIQINKHLLINAHAQWLFSHTFRQSKEIK